MLIAFRCGHGHCNAFELHRTAYLETKAKQVVQACEMRNILKRATSDNLLIIGGCLVGFCSYHTFPNDFEPLVPTLEDVCKKNTREFPKLANGSRGVRECVKTRFYALFTHSCVTLRQNE